MDSLIVYGTLIITVVVGLYLFKLQMLKGYMVDIGKDLGMLKYDYKSDLGSAKVVAKGVFKNTQITLDAFLVGPGMPNKLVMSAQHRSTFAAVISPGIGLAIEKQEAAAAKKAEETKDDFKPWRPKLTKEEQQVIDSRRKGGTNDDTPKEKFHISSIKMDEVNKFLAEGDRSQVIAGLFDKGIQEIRITFTDVAMDKIPYDETDFNAHKLEAYLNDLKKLVVKRIEP